MVETTDAREWEGVVPDSAPDVYQCIAKVQAALCKEGVGKTRRNMQQGYQFRGIDDMYNAVAPALAEAGLIILPSYDERVLVERTSAQDKALFYVTVKAMYRLVSAHDGSSAAVGPFWGEAMDSGDKATNKAMSAAYKYMLMQVGCIPTEGDNDADSTTHDVKAKPAPFAEKPHAQQEREDTLASLTAEERQEITDYCTRIITPWLASDVDQAFEAYKDVLVEGSAVGWELNELKTAMWVELFPHSKLRSTIKRMQQVEDIRKVPLGAQA